MLPILPKLSLKKYKICIVCEGYEESEYIEKLDEINVFDSQYDIVVKNAETLSQVFNVYQDSYASRQYDLVVAFCDTERFPYEDFIREFNRFKQLHHKAEEGDLFKVIYFSNPCTLQIVLSHFGEIKLTTSNKKKNQPTVMTCTGVSGYKGREDQRTTIYNQITVSNFEVMKKNIQKINTSDFKIVSSTNFYNLVDSLESKKTDWLDNINKMIS